MHLQHTLGEHGLDALRVGLGREDERRVNVFSSRSWMMKLLSVSSVISFRSPLIVSV